MLYWFLKIFISIPLMLLYPTKVIGRKNIPKKGAAIEICNHRRMFDPFIVGLYQRRRLRFFAKIEIFKTFILKGALKSLGAIPVDRKKVSMTSMKRVLKVLKDGKIMLIFPEGSRNKTDDNSMQEFKNGISTFALMSKAPLIPIFMLNKSKLFRLNYIFVGEPIVLEEFYNVRPTPEVLEQTNKIITDKMNLLRDYAVNYKSNKKALKAKKASGNV